MIYYNLLRLINLAPQPGDVQATLPLSFTRFLWHSLVPGSTCSYPTFEIKGYIIHTYSVYHDFIRLIEIEGLPFPIIAGGMLIAGT